jgi:hypothetical protein
MNNYRHGDVDLLQTNSLPEGLVKQDHNGSFPIAFGEVTGHRHMVTTDRPQDMNIYLDPSTNLHVLELKTQAKLSHEEHTTIALEPGIYIQKQEQEYDPFEKELRQVAD